MNRDHKNGNQVEEKSVHLIVFKVANEEYGIPIEQVREVTITPDIAKMPKMPSFIKGVANIRGNIIAIMDLEERFGLPPTETPNVLLGRIGVTYTLVIEIGNYSMGIQVKDVPQSLSVPLSKIDRSPGLIKDISMNEQFIEGIVKLEGRLIVILDIGRLLSKEETAAVSNVA